MGAEQPTGDADLSGGPTEGAMPTWAANNLAVEPTVGWSDVEGCRARWLRWGDSALPPLVLVHGGAAHAQWWSFLAPFFTDRYCVVAPELSGMGDSGWRDDYRTEVWAAEVVAALGAAGQGAAPHHKAILVGHSMGGSVVAVAAAHNPALVDAVVLCDMGVRGSERRRSRRFANRVLYPSRDEAVARFGLTPRQDCANTWAVRYLAETSVRPVGHNGPADPARPGPGTEIGWTWKFDWGLFARTSELSLAETLSALSRQPVPLAAIHGADSRIVDGDVAARTEAAYGRPFPTTWLAGAAHHLMLDQPLGFVDALDDILARLGCPSADQPAALSDSTTMPPA